METPPRTIMEVYKSLPEGTLAELIDNVIYMSPSPVTNHQRILLKLSFQFSSHLESGKGEVLIAPFDVYLDETSNAVQPDIVIILNDNPGLLEPNGHFHGVPDLLVEVLSPGNKDHDLVKKKDLYDRFGVKEYWIVDPETNQALCYSLSGSKYVKAHEQTAAIHSLLLGLDIIF